MVDWLSLRRDKRNGGVDDQGDMVKFGMVILLYIMAELVGDVWIIWNVIGLFVGNY